MPTLEEIWSAFGVKLEQFLRSRVADPAVAADLRQEVFVRIQKRLGDLRDPVRLEAWMYQIARNAVIDQHRSRRETVEVSELLPAEPDAADPGLRELTAAFRRMVENLPAPYREAVVRTEFDGVTQKQLAADLGISLSGAKSRVQRGRALLRRMLEDCCTFEFDRRGAVLDCTPRVRASCEECG
ncbi:MAG: RNA polymerase sigma factor SigZ [Verrucomicrobia bacterium]|nr:RNA polymerase sigma factor SigZ [Verrucomicrobiota bacterium]